ncbi:hypothetical protein N7478_008091 [Penicillium angulare]|uniref:uncharacterized protein n=1 Tax=Penicillium angulare TaxID=116970 RepID=UPI00254228AF|nr:uncharacterized protein N7478_011804 [Penicillium angulare]XP_056777031.1 uncharacterized protein N7478_008091 [Penicillium angulare]KAJ5261209.1 hypothetical protein N7478_011804 [Penicillium angulare]KAJ5272966.1 hypothetical protein N7478_008091 [Penicillium angulare]
MADFYENEVFRMEEAVGYASTLKKPNLTQIAEEYAISYYTLYRRVRQKSTPRIQRKPQNKALNDVQEKALSFWIRSLDEAFIPPTPNIIEQWANLTLARSGTSDRTVGKNWVYRFIQRFPDVDFEMRRQKIPRLAGEEHGERVTVAECIAADGWRMEPLVIFKGRHQMEAWYDTKLPEEWMTATIEKGYMVDELAVLWIKEFDRQTQYCVKQGEQRILLVDGCGSYLTFEFLNSAEKAGIKIFGFPLNKINYIQPLDGKPFLAYKAYFR